MTAPQPPFPGIYQAPRRHRGVLGWAIVIVSALLIVGVVVLALGVHGLFKTGQSGTVVPTRQDVQSSILASSSKYISGVRTVTCVMPSAWTPGDTFTCYAYGITGRELAQVNGTVLPNASAGPDWNEVWLAVG